MLRVRYATKSAEARLRGLGLITPVQSYSVEKDLTLEALYHDQTIGVMCLRPMYFAHTFNLIPGILPQRVIADALFRFSDGMLHHEIAFSERPRYGSLFQVHRDNDKMQGYIASKGAVTEPGSLLYRYDAI